MSRVDLHTHSHYSDGTESPRRVVELAKAAGVSALSLTDHDILDGHPEAEAACRELGLEFIPGVEFSSSTNGLEVHMLGFLVDAAHAPFRQVLERQRVRRLARIHDMVGKLRAVGVMITVEDVLAASGKGVIGRPHVAQALLNRGYVATLREAFDRYIGPKGPGFISGSPTPPEDAIRIIREAGGVPVLAHPVYLKDDNLIDGMVREGLAGLEVYHSSHPPDVVARYEQLADRFGLLRTGGSDFHGAAKEGAPVGSVDVPYACVERLKAWKQAHPRAL
jgi:predicted metal-dependent phosphoesterase TrpH